jgi:chemotaxis signal transduction protein
MKTHTSRAWVMDVGEDVQVAAGSPHVVEYLLAPETIDIPRTPRHCAGLLVWRERMIPVIDLARLFAGWRTASQRAVILAYQESPGQPLRYGALLVRSAPTETWVSDDMACALPQTHEVFRHFARACFANEDRAIPILDTRRLFTRPVPESSPQSEEADDGASRLTDITLTGRRGHALDEAPGRASRERDGTFCGPPEFAGPRPAPEPSPLVMNSGYETRAEPVKIPSFFGETCAETVEEIILETPGPMQAGDLTNLAASPAGRNVDAPSALETCPPQAAVLPEGMAAASFAAGTSPADGHDVPRAHEETTRRVRAPARSSTLHSFQRMRAIERQHLPARRRSRRWPLLVVAIILLGVILLRYFPAGSVDSSSLREADPQPPPVARDVTLVEIMPASIPSAPAQPPK